MNTQEGTAVLVHTLLFPDRNVVHVIKTAVSGRPQKGAPEEKMLARLRQWDTPSYAFSPLLSLIEGEHGREDSASEKMEAQISESAAFKAFFKQAVTDSEFLDGAREHFAATFAGLKEGAADARAVLLARGARLVAEKVAVGKRRAVEADLIQISDDAGLHRADATLVLLLACLYGNDSARRVLKPHKQPMQAYNVLSDIHLIPRIGMVKAVVNHFQARLNVRLVTLDGGLEEVLRKVQLAACSSGPGGELQMQITYQPELFTDLDRDAAIDLLHRINGQAEEEQLDGEPSN